MNAIPIPKIIKHVADRYGVTAQEILSQGRTQRLCEARQMAMLLALEYSKLPISLIPNYFNRTRSGVEHAAKRGRELVETDRKCRTALVGITNALIKETTKP